jgi:hypothetical protein
MSLAQNFTKQLEDLVGVPNAFGSEDLDMEELMDDDSDQDEEPYDHYQEEYEVTNRE